MDPNTGHIFPIPEGIAERYPQSDLTEQAIEPSFAARLAESGFSFEAFNVAMDEVKGQLAHLEDSRAKSIALTKLDEAVLWATQATGSRKERRSKTIIGKDR